VETGLAAALKAVDARSGGIVWLEAGKSTGLAVRDGVKSSASVPESQIEGALATTPFIYDLPKGRALRRDVDRNLHAIDPAKLIGPGAIKALGLRKGVAIPLHSDAGDGVLFLENVSNLSVDHVDLGQQISANVAAHFQSHALLKAAEESAEARSRLSLARDLHDSVVQFLAGAAFRLEAMKRSVASDRDVEPELNELKQLMLQEQGELRTFISALRSGSQIALSEVAKDLKALADRLCRQWSLACEFEARPAAVKIPSRLHLDIQQMVREAVANAARHAGAKSISIELAAMRVSLRLDLTNDGARYPRTGESIEMPQSLRERVEQAGGEIEISRGMGVTKLSISLPINGADR
jgi:signal transduction histidine kinase